jgi:hypothetical protein
MLTECRIFAQPTPDGEWLDFPPAQKALIDHLVEMIADSVQNKAQLGVLPFPENTVRLSMN